MVFVGQVVHLIRELFPGRIHDFTSIPPAAHSLDHQYAQQQDDHTASDGTSQHHAGPPLPPRAAQGCQPPDMAASTTPTWPPASSRARGLQFPRPPVGGPLRVTQRSSGPLRGGAAGPHLPWLAQHGARVSPPVPSDQGDDRIAYPPVFLGRHKGTHLFYLFVNFLFFKLFIFVRDDT